MAPSKLCVWLIVVSVGAILSLILGYYLKGEVCSASTALCTRAPALCKPHRAPAPSTTAFFVIRRPVLARRLKR
eukprot:6070657-Pleurochrysis_carterae.AAC.3